MTWSNDIRYLGVYLTANNVYSCSFSHAKRSFYRAFNGVFGSVGRVASEEVVVELMKKMSSNSVLCHRSYSPEQSTH